MSRLENQTAVILAYLKAGNTITSIEAFQKFQITRLSAIIFNLRKKWHIVSESHETINRYGDTVRFSEYRLIGELKDVGE